MNDQALILTKYKDNTFTITVIPYIYGPHTKAEIYALALWQFKMNKNQVDTGFGLFEIGYDIVTYKNLQFDSVQKIDYTEGLIK